MLQTTPEMEMMTRVVMDVKVIVNWLRADNFTSRQLIVVRKPVIIIERQFIRRRNMSVDITRAPYRQS